MEATHTVLDLVYTPDEGQECFEGTEQECNDFIQKQGGATFMFKVVPIIKKVTEYPLAFLTRANCLFMKSETDVSADGTPRYIPNPNSNATYCLKDCMKDYTPIYSKEEVEKYS